MNLLNSKSLLKYSIPSFLGLLMFFSGVVVGLLTAKTILKL